MANKKKHKSSGQKAFPQDSAAKNVEIRTAKSQTAAASSSGKAQNSRSGGYAGKRADTVYREKPKKHGLLDWITLIPLMIPLAVIPLLMQMYSYDCGLETYPWFIRDGMVADFFLYYKQWTFVAVAGVMLFFLILRACINSRSLKFLPAFVPLGIYALLSLISTLASEYRTFGILGSYEQFENVFCLIGYGIVVYYAFLFVEDEKDLKILLTCFSIGLLIMTTLGTFQTFKKDLFTTDFGKKLFLPKEAWNNLNDYVTTFPEGQAYMTLYNPNYVGVYAALTSPILLVLVLLAKPLYLKVLNAVDLVLVLICLYGSGSKAGLIGLAAAMACVVIFMRKPLIKRFYITVPVIVILLIGGFLAGGKGLIDKVISALSTESVDYNITNVATNDDEIAIEYKGNTIHINYIGDKTTFYSFYIYDDNKADIPYSVSEDGMTYTITDERFAGFTLMPVLYDDIMAFRVTMDGYDWYFSNQYDDNTYYYITAYGRPDKIVMAEEGLFGDHESFASHRGYLWSRTLPLLKKYIVLGSGADSFVQVFTQQDYVGKINNNYDRQVITKPHNMYLQIGVQTGVLSLIAFLVFYGFYFINSLILYIGGRFKSFASQVGVGIFAGTIGYMVCGISNDSMIVVSPLFWTLLGIGFAANAMTAKERKQEKAMEAAEKERAAA